MSSRNIDDVEHYNRVDSYLELFDSLDLDEKSHRRMSVWVLDELFRRTLSSVGREYLGFTSGNRERNVKILWQKSLDRFELMDQFEEPEQYSGYVRQIHSFRNNTAHNTDYDPPQSNLEDIRGEVDDWLEWLLSESLRYNSEHEETPPRELMIGMAKRSLNKILAETEDEDITDEFEDWHTDIRENAVELYETIEFLENEEAEISVELIDALVDALELARDYEQMQKTEAQFWSEVNARIDEHLLRRDPGH
ncbi:hypothetical protein [Halobacterium jilantaiense]|uniref:DUF4145 domain-containing protein n=1 Tax=Halobacterium jilantaiense TaxID=355548 RepID=A0A1I0NHI1_9EURY|nr:hypothetical protein [Halobacterium jilantaiense]SEW00671.1 hypothetical protein SAMN04487945_0869 [Halobacterium jilantaiense]